MAATGEDALRVLQQIDAKLGILIGLFSMQQANPTPRAAAAPVNPFNGPPVATVPAVAPDTDLDSNFGDEKIRFNPRDWTGESCLGRTMSECPAPFLESLAKVYDYFAAKNEAAKAMTDKGQPKWVYDQRTASRARGWAARVKAGHKPKAAPEFGDDSAIPF